MATKWDAQAKIDKAVLEVLRQCGLGGAEFATLYDVVKPPHRVALSQSLQRLIGQQLVEHSHDVKSGSASRYVWVVPVAMREQHVSKAGE